MKRFAKFNIGDIVFHKQLGYRAVIVDIDPLFQASERYYSPVRLHHLPSEHLWYRLLVDHSSQMTYVQEEMLLLTNEIQNNEIENPLIEMYQQRKIH